MAHKLFARRAHWCFACNLDSFSSQLRKYYMAKEPSSWTVHELHQEWKGGEICSQQRPDRDTLQLEMVCAYTIWKRAQANLSY